MLSVSVMGRSLHAIYDKMVEINKGIQAMKMKNSRTRLREKKRELKSLSTVYYYLLRKINYLKVCFYFRSTNLTPPKRSKINSLNYIFTFRFV